MWCTDPVNLFRLATFVQNDTEPPPMGRTDAAYLFGHTPANEESVLTRGCEIRLYGKTEKLLVCGGGPYISPDHPNRLCAYSGGIAWKNYLTRHGADPAGIECIARPELSHTGTEAEQLVLRARKEKWQNVYIVAAPFHLLRAFVTTVSQILQLYPDLRIWCKPGTPLPWFQGGVSSQGIVGKTRLGDFMEMEWERLNKTYGNQYDIAPESEVFKYLERRGG